MLMKKIITIATLSALVLASPAYAQTQNEEKVKLDIQALGKDNQVLANEQHNLSKLRAAKAADKTSGRTGKQALDSLKIGVNQLDIQEKQSEKNSHEKKLMKDGKAVNQDNAGK